MEGVWCTAFVAAWTPDPLHPPTPPCRLSSVRLFPAHNERASTEAAGAGRVREPHRIGQWATASEGARTHRLYRPGAME